MCFRRHLASLVFLLHIHSSVLAQPTEVQITLDGPVSTQTTGIEKTMSILAKSLLERNGMEGKPWNAINYGTGKDVSDETMADAGQPVELQLLGNSYIRVPVGQTTQ